MKKYFAFFKIRFIANLQYRAAAFAGISTQFAWGFLTVFLFKAFYETSPQNFPMSFSATVSYIWIQQAFLAFFALWGFEPEVNDAIVKGSAAYLMVRPVSIYNLWFVRTLSMRLARGLLRCFPILITALLLPLPYSLVLPNLFTFSLFLFSLILGLFTATAFIVLIYILSFFTISPRGLQMLFISVSEILAGQVIPIPFFPDKIRAVIEVLPFTGIQNIPLRIFGGDIKGVYVYYKIALQLFWLIVLILCGKIISKVAEKKLVVQGG